jgi:hypothetical protein
MRQEFSNQLQTEVQSIANKVDLVRESTGMALTDCVRKFESAYDGMNGSMNAFNP